MPEPWIERVIREASDAGTFDDVAGRGKPIPDIDRPYDPGWWARRWIARERQREETIALARAVDAELPPILARSVENDVRTGLESLNRQISDHNESVAEGDLLPLLDVEGLLAERASRRKG